MGQNAQYQPQSQGQDYAPQQAPSGDQSYDNGQPGEQQSIRMRAI